MRKVDEVNFDFTDFEDEIVVVDIQKGVYFSIKGDAPVIFRIFQAGDVVEPFEIDEQNLKAQLSENPVFIIEIQDNISDLIKLDPIHDVTPTKGWPNKAND